MGPAIVGLSGPAGCGKSTVADALAKQMGSTVRVRFSGPLKAMLAAYLKACGLSDREIDRRIEGDLKEVPCETLGGRTPRYAMQTLGTEWGRVLMKDSFWVDAWTRNATRHRDNGWHVVAEDCRFENEAEAIRGLNGTVVMIDAEDPRREKSDHVSERTLPKRLVDHVLPNRNTLQALFNRVTWLTPRLLHSRRK